MTENFADRLCAAVRHCRNVVCVGLDPRLESLPKGYFTSDPSDVGAVAETLARFCRDVIDVVAPLVPVVKPQAAFFEQYGPYGMLALGEVVAYARERGLLVVFDGKRNDIGPTASAYAAGLLGPDSPWKADALTVSPYLGDDSLEPFVTTARQCGAGLFVLVKTSNPGGKLFQDLSVGGRPVYRFVADLVEQLAGQTLGQSGYGSVGAVVGATYPEQLAELRRAMPRTIFLVPGFGSQGGAAADVAGAFDAEGLGAIVNNSRGIIFAYRMPQFERFAESDWQGAVEAAARLMIEQLNEVTNIGKMS